MAVIARMALMQLTYVLTVLSAISSDLAKVSEGYIRCLLRTEAYRLDFASAVAVGEERPRQRRRCGCGGAAAAEWNLGMFLLFT